MHSTHPWSGGLNVAKRTVLTCDHQYPGGKKCKGWEVRSIHLAVLDEDGDGTIAVDVDLCLRHATALRRLLSVYVTNAIPTRPGRPNGKVVGKNFDLGAIIAGRARSAVEVNEAET